MAHIIIRQDAAAGRETGIGISTILILRLLTVCTDPALENLTKKQPDGIFELAADLVR